LRQTEQLVTGFGAPQIDGAIGTRAGQRLSDPQIIASPVDGHAPSDPVHQKDVWRRWVAWLKEHLDGGTR